MCPVGTYIFGDVASEEVKCEMCDESCASCDGSADLCTSCEVGLKLEDFKCSKEELCKEEEGCEESASESFLDVAIGLILDLK